MPDPSLAAPSLMVESLVMLALSPSDRHMLGGEEGEAAQLAMRILVASARASGADRLIDVASAHIDGCLYHGQVSLDFAERLVAAGAGVSIPATLNVGSLDLLHPDRFRGDPVTAARARRLMDLYVAMGCRPTWTCAPYQLPASRPSFGQHVAWAESNAIVFANSVLGARTDRYGDFIDICAAVTGRAPDAGFHRTENRRGQAVFRIGPDVPPRLLDEDVLYPVLGHLIGQAAGPLVPVVEGLPPTLSEDRLKAMGAAAASSGSVALFHVVGVTPEAATLDDALQGGAAVWAVDVPAAWLRSARASLSTPSGGRLDAVSLGTPHFSVEEFARLMPLIQDVTVHPGVTLYVSTSREVLTHIEARGWLPVYQRPGIRLVTDTCTYITPILSTSERTVMTNSAKWAYYAPANIGVQVVFGSLEECVRSAVEGRVRLDAGFWA